MRVYTETPYRLTPPRQTIVVASEPSALTMLEAYRREHDRQISQMRARMKRQILPIFWRQVLENLAANEARTTAMRPSIGKPLSRRARRRNRGRVRAAKAALMRKFTPSVEWAWQNRDAA